MSPIELQTEMQARVRKHMLVSLGGVVLGIVGTGVLAGVIRAATGTEKTALMGLSVVPIFLIPVIGLWSTSKNLRCPSCDCNVAMQVSWNFSIFGGWAAKGCGGCGQQIFPANTGRRFLRLMLIMMGAALAFVGAGALFGAHAAKNRPVRAEQPAPAQSGR